MKSVFSKFFVVAIRWDHIVRLLTLKDLNAAFKRIFSMIPTYLKIEILVKYTIYGTLCSKGLREQANREPLLQNRDNLVSFSVIVATSHHLLVPFVDYFNF